MSEPVTIRASSIGALMDCPARWLAIHREGRRVPTTHQAKLGHAVHAGTAVFDRERVAGQTPSLTAATDAAVETVLRPTEDVAWDDNKPEDVADVAASLTSRYCTLFAPTVEYAAVEVEPDALHLTDLGIVLTGTTDRVCRAAGGLGVADLKTGKTAVKADGSVETKGHAGQLGVYEILAEAGIGQPMAAPAQIIGLQTNLTPEKQRIAAVEVAGCKEVLLGDELQTGLLPVAARLAHGEMTFGNPRSIMCSPKFCPRYSNCFWRR